MPSTPTPAEPLATAAKELQELFPDKSISIRRQEFYGTRMFASGRAPWSVSIQIGDIGFSTEETVERAMEAVRAYHKEQHDDTQ